MSLLRLQLVSFGALLVACVSSASCSTVELRTEGSPAVQDDAPVADAGSTEDGSVTIPDAGDVALDLRIDGLFARSAQALPAGGMLIVYERPVHLKERWGRPLRTVAWLDRSGHELARREATAGRELLDAAVHPSGEVSLLEASDDGYSLVRVDANGAIRAETTIVDEAIASDPPAILPSESRSPIELATHDTGRLAPDGEGVFLATRTGRHSVVAYRMDVAGTHFAQHTRTLVVPAYAIAPTGLNGGSYDTFGQLDAHYGVFVAVDSTGVGWVGVGHARIEGGAFVRAHQKVFGEKLVTDPDYLDVFVSRISPSGARLGTTVVSTENDEQLYGIRAIGDGVYAVGRSETWNELGTGFDALVAHVDRDGTPTVRTFDVDRSDIAFDVAQASDGALLVAGASGYVQNPNGASVSEESHTFVRRLSNDGTTMRVGDVPDGPRHNEVRFMLSGPTGLVVGGLLDGPGTHSADTDPQQLRARAFAKRLGPI